MTAVYTSITSSYLPNARILAKSVKKHHPEWYFILLLSDLTPPSINWESEPFDEVLFSHELPVQNFKKWFFKYTVVELCTAVKGKAAQYIFDTKKADKIIYLDPDTVMFSKMNDIEDKLDSYDVILTPHITDAATTEPGIHNHEMAALKHGTFNLGFYAFNSSSNGRKYVDWWADRIEKYSYADFDKGLFTDQKWANLAPYIFEGVHVELSKTYNTATWNLNNRKITKDKDGNWLVNGNLLHFYHFSGFGNDFYWANSELELFTKKGDPLRDLWNWYKKQYKCNKDKKKFHWKWSKYENGEYITDDHRRRFRDDLELQNSVNNPYSDEMYHLMTN